MPKIAIISRPDQGVLIDVGGCATLQEATQQLVSTLEISGEFWRGLSIELNLGDLSLTTQEVGRILAIVAEAGIKPAQVFASNPLTVGALTVLKVPVATGRPSSSPAASEQAAPGPAAAGQETGGAAESPEAGPVDGSPEATAAAETGGQEPAPADGGTGAAPGILYLRQTLRSGQSVSHKGHLVIIGDVNPGAEVTADGDITVWGALRGIAHAGLNGDAAAEIRALRLEPIQLRIAHAIARAPDRPRKGRNAAGAAETARIVNGTIRIAANTPD